MHYCIYVFGDDLNYQLEPFRETGSEGEITEYDKFIDIKNRFKLDFITSLTLRGSSFLDYVKIACEFPVVDMKDYKNNISLIEEEYPYGYIVVDNGEVVKVMERWNPNSIYDYYVIGGRYKNIIPTRQGKMTTSAKVGDIDIIKMKNYKLFVPYAYIIDRILVPKEVFKDGRWYEITDEDWESGFEKFIKNIPSDTIMTVIDAHS